MTFTSARPGRLSIRSSQVVDFQLGFFMGWVCPLWLISYRHLGYLLRSSMFHLQQHLLPNDVVAKALK
jgi:hypothetical protein